MSEPSSLDPNAPENCSDEKLLILGKLSRGIAHDLKNLLAGVQGNTELALREFKNEKLARKALTNVMLAARSAHELTEQISAYSRHDNIPHKVLDLRETIASVERLLEGFVSPSVNLRISVPDSPACVVANPSQMQQLIMNLCQNALQAIGSKEGELCVTLGIDDTGANITLEVSDTGPGISAEILPRIFDPYFTTKELGLGTGLGLAVAQKIVQDSGGDIQAASIVGKRTTFSITLPHSDEAPEPEAPLPTPEDFPEDKKAILLVDDEPIMRGLGMDILHTLGYRVSVAENGSEALEMIKRHPDYFDVILSDSKMPEMSGPELAEQLYSIRPGLPFILVTAFNDASTEARLKELGVTEIVQKPFLIENLSRALSNALAQGKQSAS
ncbi:ATP-binding protein [Ruficoccus sp. ZRK36]|uniref:hybrid sensor histidine kinase/response regulator n=1 Tax=Ruficoccus sp. ZRK36 TaxID=2866311 RepID=UPI001C731F34|nr:ATP-binding protein [Ruficoccus sp. ZRK36]QYY36418.1 response regulator [Ruficoccus sp. ZRK36]